MSVFGLGSVPTAGGSSPASSSGSGGGGGTGQAQSLENAFLQLLVAQLQYQDPLQPMSNTQFVTQLAQMQTLSVLEQIKADLDRLVSASTPAGSGAAGTSPTQKGVSGS